MGKVDAVEHSKKKQYLDMRVKSDEKVLGKRFSRITVISFSRYGNWYHKYYWCKCDCGTEKEIDIKHLKSGRTKSCGCFWQENKHNYTKTHGGTYESLYAVWSSMKERCNNPGNDGFKYYGGRGIKVSAEWEKYDVFRVWALSNGYVKGLEIDRKDNDLGYNSENCHFVTKLENARNKRNTIRLELEGKNMTLGAWSEWTGIGIRTLWARKKAGWSDIDILTKPVDRRFHARKKQVLCE